MQGCTLYDDTQWCAVEHGGIAVFSACVEGETRASGYSRMWAIARTLSTDPFLSTNASPDQLVGTTHRVARSWAAWNHAGCTYGNAIMQSVHAMERAARTYQQPTGVTTTTTTSVAAPVGGP